MGNFCGRFHLSYPILVTVKDCDSKSCRLSHNVWIFEHRNLDSGSCVLCGIFHGLCGYFERVFFFVDFSEQVFCAAKNTPPLNSWNLSSINLEVIWDLDEYNGAFLHWDWYIKRDVEDWVFLHSLVVRFNWAILDLCQNLGLQDAFTFFDFSLNFWFKFFWTFWRQFSKSGHF